MKNNRFSGFQVFRMLEKGFTLLEILIVVSIIAILVTIIMPNFLGVRSRARDARRKSDVSQIQKALELYKSDQSPISYPASTFMAGLCNACWSSGASCTGNIYMPKMPCDPQTAAVYTYTRNSTDPTLYTLTACLENTQDANRDTTNIAPCLTMNPVKASYTLKEP